MAGVPVSGAVLVIVSVPLVVIGPPVTLIPVPFDVATLVAVPVEDDVPAPISDLTSAAVIPEFRLGVAPSLRIAGVPVSGAVLVMVRVPLVVIGPPVTLIPVPFEVATLVTVPVCAAGAIPSSLDPSDATSRPSTVPPTAMLPPTVRLPSKDGFSMTCVTVALAPAPLNFSKASAPLGTT